MESVKAMKEGKKVRRKGWNPTFYWDEDLLFDLDNSPDSRRVTGNLLNHFEATDWEIYEEKKTLSDDIHDYARNNVVIRAVPAYRVKESLKEFIGTLFFERTEEQIKDKAKEIFGERLV